MADPVITVSEISSTILDSNGVPRPNIKVQFVPQSTPYVVDADIVSSLVMEATTDVNGYFEINLSYGSYQVLISDTDSFFINVPADGLPHSLISLASSPLPVISLGNGSLAVDVSSLAAVLQNSGTVEFTRKGNADAARKRIAVIGSYGIDNSNEAAVAALVATWNPDCVIAAGDNNYPAGDAGTIDNAVGKYYSNFLYPYSGSYGAGSPEELGNRFWPVPGEADWGNVIGGGASLAPYLAYFEALAGARYYKKTIGACEFFFINSDKNEPDGFSSVSVQALWLQAQLTASTASWKIVVFHHSPYSSETGYADNWMADWNFALWGADLVISGHSKTYERIVRSGLTFLNVGCSGANLSTFGAPVTGSAFRYATQHGALLMEANEYSLRVRFSTKDGIGQESFDLFSRNKNTISASVKYDRDRGLICGEKGLAIDFSNMGFLRGLFSQALSRLANIPSGALGNFVYLAYASNSSGADFTTVFNASLDYIAIKISPVAITNPTAPDFAGLWKRYSNNSVVTASYAQVVFLDKEASALASHGLAAYSTFQAAYDAAKTIAVADDARVLIRVGVCNTPFGVTDFGNCVLSAAWDSRVEIEGVGANLSVLGTVGDVNRLVAYPIEMYARNCKFQAVLASVYSAASGDGEDITITGNCEINTVEASCSFDAGGSGGNIVLNGCVCGSVTTASYPPSALTGKITLTDVTGGGNILSEGGEITLIRSVTGNVSASYTDIDGAHLLGKGGTVRLDNSSASLINVYGEAFAADGPPMDAGNVELVRNSICANIDAHSRTGKGGIVNVSSSNTGLIDVSSQGDNGSYSTSAQYPGSVIASSSRVNDIIATSNIGPANVQLTDVIAGNIDCASDRNSASTVVMIRSQAGIIDCSSNQANGGFVSLDKSNSDNISVNSAEGNGGQITLTNSSGFTLEARATGTDSGNGGTVTLNHSTCEQINVATADTANSSIGGYIVAKMSSFAEITYNGASDALSGVLRWTHVEFTGHLPVLRAASYLRYCSITRSADDGPCIEEIKDDGSNGPIIMFCTLSGKNSTYTIEASAPENIQMAYTLLNGILHPNITNIYSVSVDGVNPNVVYTTDPNAEMLVPQFPLKPCMAYSEDGTGSVFGWRVSTQTWV